LSKLKHSFIEYIDNNNQFVQALTCWRDLDDYKNDLAIVNTKVDVPEIGRYYKFPLEHPLTIILDGRFIEEVYRSWSINLYLTKGIVATRSENFIYILTEEKFERFHYETWRQSNE
jgi:hypothetical protein